LPRPMMFPAAAPFEQVLHQRLRWMVRVRWLAGIGILLTVLLADRITGVRYCKPPLYLIVLFIFCYNLLLEYRFARIGAVQDKRSLLFYANLQIALDFASLIGLVALAGGVQNLFVFYAVFHIVIGSILLPRRNMLIVTVLFCLSCAGLFWSDFFGLLPRRFGLEGFMPASVKDNPSYVFGLTYIFVTAIAVTAYMAMAVIKNLRDAEKRLLALTREIDQQRMSCEQKSDEIIRLENEKKKFFELASSQLKQPLADIREMISGLSCRPGDEERLDRVLSDVRILEKLVDDMRETARLSDLGIEIMREEVDLAAAARSAVAAVTPLAERKGIRIVSEIAMNVPRLRGDREGWRRVFENLLENAVIYSEGGRVEIRLERDWQGEWASARIKDSGRGIDPAERDKVFEDFYRGDEAKRSADGTGMGLSIARRVIEMHGGSIELKSGPEGTCVSFRVPAS